MGRNLLVKIGDGGSPENFATVAGLRATTLAFNAQSIDITDNTSTGMWRELLAGGIKSATISGNGVFKDAGSDETLRQAFFDQACPDFQIVIPGFGAVTGPFKITALK
jgi:TP901-1 family phage major tail protein